MDHPSPALPDEAAIDAVEQAITTRRSVRGFLPAPVPRPLIERLLAVASRAPSGTNTQPWQMIVLSGAALARFTDAMTAQVRDGAKDEPDYPYYPSAWHEPYLGRRREVGWALYSRYGVGKGDRDGAARVALRNYSFFGAPVGMICTAHRDMGIGSLIDCGMFLENLMIAARGHGLDSCAQAAFALYPNLVRAQLGLTAERRVVCGLALGWADEAEPANALRTPREPVAGFTRFLE